MIKACRLAAIATLSNFSDKVAMYMNNKIER
jgi:hypothetical protein